MATSLKSFHRAFAQEVAPAPSPSQLQLVPYQDNDNGFAFSRPRDWIKADKYGATVLFEDPAKKSNSVGVVVSPVRISSLEEFGSAEDIAKRLIDAEKKKPSTNSAELLSVRSRTMKLDSGDTTLYEIEYKLDSTRGTKRIFSGVTIAAKKLFIINVAVAEGPTDPIDPKTELELKSVLSSFRVD